MKEYYEEKTGTENTRASQNPSMIKKRGAWNFYRKNQKGASFLIRDPTKEQRHNQRNHTATDLIFYLLF